MVLQEIRDTSSKLADSKAFEILESAQKLCSSARFMRIRKRRLLPATDQEKQYLEALGQYVKYKLLLHKHRSDYHIQKQDWRIEMEYWRKEMDLIEAR